MYNKLNLNLSNFRRLFKSNSTRKCLLEVSYDALILVPLLRPVVTLCPFAFVAYIFPYVIVIVSVRVYYKTITICYTGEENRQQLGILTELLNVVGGSCAMLFCSEWCQSPVNYKLYFSKIRGYSRENARATFHPNKEIFKLKNASSEPELNASMSCASGSVVLLH